MINEIQQVAIVPLKQWQSLIQKLERLEGLEKRVARLEKGLKQWLSTKEACELTGISERALYDARKAGKLEYKYVGTKPLYSRTSLEEYNEGNTHRRKHNK